jgi:HlyD family secretion protein
MDTEIPIRLQHRKRNGRILLGLLALLLLGGAAWTTWSFLTPSLHRSEITTAVAQVGDIENTISASGEILPEFEETITSSIDGSIQKVLANEGARVRPGESLLTLDKSKTQTDWEKMKFQLASKRGDIDKLKLDLSESYSDIQSNNAIKQLHIGNLQDAVESAKRLFEAGGGTRESIEDAELNLKVAQEEKKQLENQITNKQQTMKLDIQEAELAADVLESDLRAFERKLRLAEATATRAGVITYLDKNIGESIHEGQTLARIADLSSFKVSGTLSDNYLDQLRGGMGAIIRINDTLLRGRVVNVHPEVSGGLVTFDIRLDQPSNGQLRSNLKVDVFLVTAIHNQVVRIANGPAFKGSKTQDIFVLRDGVARRRAVDIGLSNFDFVEVTRGLSHGDTVITSDMSDYKTTPKIMIKP